METLGYLLALATVVYLWHQLHFNINNKATDLGYEQRFKMKILDFKPFTCSTCLTFWLGLISFIVVGDIFLLSLPLAYKGVIKLIS